MSDEDLIQAVIAQNLAFVRMLNPLQISIPADVRKQFNSLWREAVRRNLHNHINDEVNRILDAERCTEKS